LDTLLSEKALVFIELEAGWAGCFGEEIVLLLLRRFEPHLPVYIPVTVLTAMHHIDLKIIQKSILII
jgi:hypothetical protein